MLLVEDEPDLGGAIKRVLTQHKYLVDWVLNGTDAWAYLENSWTKYKVALLQFYCLLMSLRLKVFVPFIN